MDNDMVENKKESLVALFNQIKTPVFWAVVGYVLGRFIDRKKLA